MRPSPLSTALLLTGLLAACETPSADPGAATAAARADGAVAIGAVQGRGGTSPLLGQMVTVEGVVTGNFRQNLGGWFVQDAGDGDDATSDALFVTAGPQVELRAGDRVRVHGRVVEQGERGSLTALEAERVEAVGRGDRVAPVVLASAPDDWERLEGMRVRIDAPLTVSGQHDLDRRGVLHAAFGGRLFTPTEVARPGPEAQRVARDNARRRLLLDDARARLRAGE